MSGVPWLLDRDLASLPNPMRPGETVCRCRFPDHRTIALFSGRRYASTPPVPGSMVECTRCGKPPSDTLNRR